MAPEGPSRLVSQLPGPATGRGPLGSSKVDLAVRRSVLNL